MLEARNKDRYSLVLVRNHKGKKREEKKGKERRKGRKKEEKLETKGPSSSRAARGKEPEGHTSTQQ